MYYKHWWPDIFCRIGLHNWSSRVIDQQYRKPDEYYWKICHICKKRKTLFVRNSLEDLKFFIENRKIKKIKRNAKRIR